MYFLVCSQVGFGRKSSPAGFAVMLGFIGVKTFYVGLQGGKMTENLRTVATAEWF